MNPKVFIITGEQGSGKTTFLKEVLVFMKQENTRYGGILAEGTWKNNLRERFDLVNLSTGEKLVYCQRDIVNGWDRIRHFYINPKGQEFGEKALDINNLKNVDLIVIDEIGPFELEGKGWSKALSLLSKFSTVPLVLVIRRSLIDQVIHKFKLGNALIFDINDDSPLKSSWRIRKDILT